ncbi:MAG TPA: SprT family zinc-dependent metalloprotease [Allosphingosinicella sp.]|jgi:hypothetical protein
MNGGMVRLGAEDIPYAISFSDRRTLGITVQPDGALIVTAPAGTPREAVEARLRKRGAWILKTRRDFERLRPRTPERRYIAGETHRFLGRQYRLRIDPAGQRTVTVTREHILVGGIPADESNRIRNRLAAWYQREARRVIRERFDACWGQHGIGQPPRLVVRPIEKRWASLSARGRSLLVNRRLVEADVDAIDFVIVHELCHLIHHDHSPEFLALLGARMPDWVQRKARLERWML